MLGNSGRPIPNQFVIEDGNGNEFFQSYKSLIAVKKSNGDILLDSYYWDYSRTTSKYRNIFLGMDTKEIKKSIKEGSIQLVNLQNKEVK